MELIYLDANRVEQGVLEDAQFVSEIGEYYEFTLTVKKNRYKDLVGGYVYPRGAFAFGGKILKCTSRSYEDLVTFTGRTWMGMLGTQTILSFAYVAGQDSHKMSDYLIDLLYQAAYTPVMQPDTDYVLPQAATLPDGTNKEPKTVLELTEDLYRQANMVPVWRPAYDANGKMTLLLGGKSRKTYSSDDYSSDVLPVEVEVDYQKITKIIIGYAQSNGSLMQTRIGFLTSAGTWLDSAIDVIHVDYTGFDGHVVAVVLSQEEATVPQRFDFQKLADELQADGSATVSIAGKLVPDVGDTVIGKDLTTGIVVQSQITSKTLNLTKDVSVFSFQTR